MWVRALPCTVLLTACIDYTPAGKPGDSVPAVTDDSDVGDTSRSDTGSGDTAPLPVEECDGVDNDGDGLVDEEFADSDGDAIADCVDTSCVVSLDRSEGISDSSTCANEVTPSASPWEVELMWSADEADLECVHPVVADLDGDGSAEVLCPATYEREVSVVDGRTGLVEATWPGFLDDTHLAVADLDRDGELEVAGIGDGFLPIAVNRFGSLLWTGEIELALGARSFHLEARDVGGDGRAEILSHMGAVRGSDGGRWSVFDSRGDVPASEFQVVAEDLDRDSTLELAYAWTVLDLSTRTYVDLDPPGQDHGFALPMPLQADGDEEAELVWTTMDNYVLAEANGSVIAQRAYSGTDATTVSVPCAGDIDGDGEMEFVAVGADAFHAWSADGALEWSVPMYDATPNWGGCTTFDFDLDGAKEVVAVDQEGLYILDGTTGATLVFASDDFASSTAGDVPLVVDLDGDGSVEILVPSPYNLYDTQLHAWRNVNRDWPPGTAMWPSTTWSGTSLLPDGRVPRTPHAPWLTTKVWRGQPEAPVYGSDLRPAVGDSCVASCADEGEVRVEVRLQNLGPDEIEAGAPLAVYGLDASGARVLLSVLALTEWLDDGRAAASWEVVTTTAKAKRGLVFVAGDDGTGSFVPDDCETANNEVAWTLTACP